MSMRTSQYALSIVRTQPRNQVRSAGLTAFSRASSVPSTSLEESDDLSTRQPRHSFRRRLLRQPRHRHDVATLRNDESGARGWTHLVHLNAEAARPAELGRVVGER